MKTLDDVILIAGHTARSQAYLQTLLAHGLRPAQVLLLGEGDTALPAPAGPARAEWLNGILLPDLDQPLLASIDAAGIPRTTVPSRDINDPALAAALGALAPRCAIFSGYGGQIVGAALIDLGVPLVHVHSGWLPDYRGSTTVYYSLLEEGRCAASAIVLDKQIDTGPILARQHYPAPPLGTDIDRRYDTAIRADVLLRVFQHYQQTGALPQKGQQSHAEGNSYYVIHPVLKHLALLGLPPA